jgi:hypothetical protein
MHAITARGIFWKKSSYSAANGNCVEVARLGARYLVRDSKNTSQSFLGFTLVGWRTFLKEVKSNRQP